MTSSLLERIRNKAYLSNGRDTPCARYNWIPGAVSLFETAVPLLDRSPGKQPYQLGSWVGGRIFEEVRYFHIYENKFLLEPFPIFIRNFYFYFVIPYDPP